MYSSFEEIKPQLCFFLKKPSLVFISFQETHHPKTVCLALAPTYLTSCTCSCSVRASMGWAGPCCTASVWYLLTVTALQNTTLSTKVCSWLFDSLWLKYHLQYIFFRNLTGNNKHNVVFCI